MTGDPIKRGALVLRRPLSFVLRALVRSRSLRSILNSGYVRLGYGGHRIIHTMFSRAFVVGSPPRSPSTWYVEFAGTRIEVPLLPDTMALDWNLALSVTGHDTGTKQTYEHLITSPQPPDVFVDVGANYGTHSLLFLACGIETISFEPNPSCHEYIRRLGAHNGVDPEIESVALGREDASATIYFPEDETWLGTLDLDLRDELAESHQLRSVAVDVKRLDEYLPRVRGRRVLLKLDTEGNELSVLEGGLSFLEEIRPVVIFECWRSTEREKLWHLLSTEGYSIYDLPLEGPDADTALSHDAFLGSDGRNFAAMRDGHESTGSPGGTP